MVSLKGATTLGLALLSSLAQCHAAPASPSPDNVLASRESEKPSWLRIMPLGASITAGDPAPPDDDSKNGYRGFLREKLRSEGWEVNMVGNFNLGSMSDNVGTPY